MKIVVLNSNEVESEQLKLAAQERYERVQVTTVCSAAELHWWLGCHQPAAVIMDLNQPDCDGFELMLELKERFPSLPLVVWSDCAFLDDLQVLEAKYQPLRFFPKLLPAEKLVARIRNYLEPVPESRVSGLDAYALIQMMHADRRSCRFEFNSTYGQGTIYLREGDVIHAELYGLSGKDAFFQLMAMPAPMIEIYAETPTLLPTIDIATELLLMEASVFHDESKALDAA